LPGLALLAETLGDIATLRDVIDREGATIATEGGSRRAHPALNAMAQARSAARGLLSDFGMSPRGRLALAAPPTKERRNEFEEFAK
jgi:P27 family predicted phage terminase small subunit